MSFLGISLPLGAEMVIIVIGIAYTILSVFLQRKLSNPKRTRDIQARLKNLTVELNTLARSNAPKEEIDARNKEIMPLMKESMQMQMKPMLVIVPMFLVMYYVLLPAIPLGITTAAKSVQLLFFVTVFILGLISSAVVLIYDRNVTKREQKQQIETAEYKNQI